MVRMVSALVRVDIPAKHEDISRSMAGLEDQHDVPLHAHQQHSGYSLVPRPYVLGLFAGGQHPIPVTII